MSAGSSVRGSRRRPRRPSGIEPALKLRGIPRPRFSATSLVIIRDSDADPLASGHRPRPRTLRPVAEATPRTAADLLVACLEAEGCEFVFSVPGEETLDLLESLSRSDTDPPHHDPPRAGRGVHGRRLRAAHGPRGGGHGHARAGRHEPPDRHRRRLPRSRARRRDHRPGVVRQAPQGGPPGRRRRRHVPAGDEVERADRADPGHPGDRAQGVPGRDAREARPDAHRAARERRRHGARGERPDPPAAPGQGLLPGAVRTRPSPRPRGSSTRPSGRSSSPATASSAGGPRRPSGRSPRACTCRWRRRSWARARSTIARTCR